ncbi:uncharacterized protein LOC135224750 [Macrobrachium nipponense]|uniref:uncharacterized protein LOC135224750 n=1 Tax=Macrobrachium nipponense TaxID=159736 RepID=UPI0030C81148
MPLELIYNYNSSDDKNKEWVLLIIDVFMAELDEFLLEMDEDTEGMQGTIYYLQQQLRQAKERIAQLNSQLSVTQISTSQPGDDSGSQILTEEGNSELNNEMEQTEVPLVPPQPNGDATHDESQINSEAFESETSTAAAPLTNGRKRTQSEMDEGAKGAEGVGVGIGDGEGDTGEGDFATNEVDGLPPQKRTRTDGEVDQVGGGVEEESTVVENELDEFLLEMDEDTEGMQGTIYYLQQQLRQAKERIAQLNSQLSVTQISTSQPGDDSGSQILTEEGNSELNNEMEQTEVPLVPPQPNGDATHDESQINSEAFESETSTAAAPLTNGRKRTQSEMDEGAKGAEGVGVGIGDGEGDTGEGDFATNEVDGLPPQKRTRTDGEVDSLVGVWEEESTVVENGVTESE